MYDCVGIGGFLINFAGQSFTWVGLGHLPGNVLSVGPQTGAQFAGGLC